MFCHCVRVASRRERSEAIPETLRLLRFARNDILDLIMTIYLDLLQSIAFWTLVVKGERENTKHAPPFPDLCKKSINQIRLL
ncbi:hypothetical protein VF14_14375 [Nostoc linckia z18]|uniref:Uncharacterized protein n=2 Tax=Nostoc linckia TaxID=92942 RepID=A0A9Q6ELK8_NOSLI|nr:hypothetical protein VF02_10830 [Nostoc linckia z1]PHJ70271.1 hypothetical protein VF05_10765 [Nostoc linckia z3]PHJ75209.1 hypothetical protein VF03_11145 [Nostoc linckia z2]PHJ79200.1 hypothetical protein VF06_26540 [Nostoc linckia z4]PHJ84087.1 hypothetical protein VF07_25730 [Nostoc linckia z6]PHJ94284.1 hypothetical protein VF04_22930 [Nostoc linckia z7]PHK03889.1 hypothetical protein VF08_13415 [Nostoc linckia z8]PHK08910.1 hypothetical protein VF09_17860 [Nostoc linckia z9]PHK1714